MIVIKYHFTNTCECPTYTVRRPTSFIDMNWKELRDVLEGGIESCLISPNFALHIRALHGPGFGTKPNPRPMGWAGYVHFIHGLGQAWAWYLPGRVWAQICYKVWAWAGYGPEAQIQRVVQCTHRYEGLSNAPSNMLGCQMHPQI